MSAGVVIVGAGQAGVQIAESLRHEQYAGKLILLGAEAHAPYNRPPLSKKWLLERSPISSLYLRGIDALQRRQIDWRPNSTVAAIDRAARRLQLTDGSTLDYAGLAIATGSSLRSLPMAGATLPGVLGLRSVEDAMAIHVELESCISTARPLVVIGGGFIGLEVAASARKRGVEVVVLESLDRLMSRVVAPIVSEAALNVHLAHGTQVHFGVQVSEIVANGGRAAAVRLADGREFPAGCIVLGVGVTPNDKLASVAGLACERGIIVDDCSRSSDAAIVAAGDCTARRMPDGSLRRLESVQNAVEQGRAAAAALLGHEKPFTATPWFWSDQYDMKLQMVGLSQGYDAVVTRGDVRAPSFSAYYFRAGKLLAVDSLNRVSEHMQARKLLDRRRLPSAAQVAHAAFDLNSLLA